MANSVDVLLSGLNSFRGGLTTASNNIANATTEGYTRQQVNIVSLPSQRQGGAFFGNGARIGSVDRIANEFITLQLRGAASETSRLDTVSAFASRIDNLLADGDGNLSVTLQTFFDGLQDLSNDPNSGPARQIVITNAESLAIRFESIDSQLETIEGDINTSIQIAVDEINSLAEQIAQLNLAISQATSQSTTNQQPNELVDERDLAILRLSELTGVSTVPVADGTVNVFIGTGQSAVIGGNAQQLAVIPDAADPSKSSVGLVAGANIIDISSQLSGGELAGLVEVRQQIGGYQNELGRIAIVLADTFNSQHRQGITNAGAFGQDFFSFASPQVANNINNSGAGTFTASIVDSGQLTASDYRIRYDGANYTLTRLDDGNTTVSAAGTFTVDGVQFNAQGVINAGDQFTIRPVGQGASSLAVSIQNANQIATSSPVRSLENVANIGDAFISRPTVIDASNPDLRDTIEVRFGNPPSTYDLVNVTDGVTVASGVAYASGSVISVNGLEFSVSGSPEVGDVFTVEDNQNSVSDNSNVISLQNLQTAKTILGSISYQESYGGLVSEVGAVTRQAQLSGEAQRRVLDGAIQARESVSGVNLDEEAINLTRFQQAYQAAAQAISVTNNLFQTILAAIN